MRYHAAGNYGTPGQVTRGTLIWSGLAAVAVGVPFLTETFAPAAMQDPPPDVIQIRGTVRDFERNHVDFNVVPTGGSGHYAMNVALDLGAEDHPTFRGTGFRVDTQWRDRVSNPIAPHLYGDGAWLVKLVSAPTIGGAATVDTWDSSVGPYGGPNVGPAPTFYIGAEMTTIEVPADLEASVNEGTVLYDGGVGLWPNPLTTDLHCNDLVIRDAATLQIDGNIRILCETLFDMRDDSSMSFTPGSSLVLYTKGIVNIQDATINSGSYDPNVFTLYHLGNTDIRIGDDAGVIATIVAPNAGLSIEDGGNFYGTYEGQTLDVANLGGFHLDESMPLDACGVQLNDTKGTVGIFGRGGIDSADSFDEWYRDVLGKNLSIPHTIDLEWNGTFYEFASDDFYPIDGQLFGNEGDDHNNYFTYTFTAYFIYEACNAQFFEFMGSDDAWLFIDGSMALDLGGIIPGTDQHVDLDRLGLLGGEVYAMRFFYAHRNPTQAIFRVRTNVPLTGTEADSVNAGFD